MTDTVTLAILAQMTTAQMVEHYNEIPGIRQVSRFSDATTGRKRLELALEAAELKLARIEGQPGVFRVVPVTAASATRHEGALLKRIRVLVPNPKRVGTASHTRFGLYRDGMTVTEYIEAAIATGVNRPKARKDIYHDRDKGLIRVEE